MKEWFKTYGWLASACFTGAAFAGQQGWIGLAELFFGIGVLTVLLGILSIVYPVVRSMFNWSRSIAAAAILVFSLVIRYLGAFYIAACVFLLRPVVRSILAELNQTPGLSFTKPSSWTACQKRYFLKSQQADVLPIHKTDSFPAHIRFTCSSHNSYWRAGVILADELYDPQQNSITDALLIHLAIDPPEGSPNVTVCESGRQTLRYAFGAPEKKYRVSMDLKHQDNPVEIRINDGSPIPLPTMQIHKWSKQVFLAAWADSKDYSVVFEDIKIF
jgi:hypothetical protein